MDELPHVCRCAVRECFYNRGRVCRAPTITIGTRSPHCATYRSSEQHCGQDRMALVGACHVTHCRFNVDGMCNAFAVAVAYHAGHAHCDTCTPAK